MSTGQPFVCPNCGTQFPYNSAFLGKRVRCPTCQQAFVVTEATNTSTVAEDAEVPGVASETHTTRTKADGNSNPDFSFVSQDKPSESALSSSPRASRSTSILDWLSGLIDIRLERYLTPYIIRFYWCVALFVIVLYGVGISLEFFLNGPGSAAQASDPSEEAMRQLFGQRRIQSSAEPDVLSTYHRVKSQIVKYLSIVCLVLAVRVWCEVLVVVFNIANFVKSINAGVTELTRQEAKPET